MQFIHPLKARTVALLVTVCVLIAWFLLGSSASLTSTFSSKAQNGVGWHQAGVANPFGLNSDQAQAKTSPQPTAIEPTALSTEGTSLDGTQSDGDWGVGSDGQLRASRALRQKFDYYLSLIGEKPLVDIEALVLNEARASLKEPALSGVTDVWRRYVQLQQHAWRLQVDLRQPTQWSAAHAERQTVRRQILGAEWAHAFYAEEESQLLEMLSQVNSPNTAAAKPPVEENVGPLHPQAAEREAALQAEWKQWDQRMDQAREQMRVLQSAPELSGLQREQAIERYLTQHFEGTELLRARSMLGV